MKVIYDTCLYIDFLRYGKHLDLFESRFQIRFLSAIVIMELNAGATSPKLQRSLDMLYYPYSKAGRILAPDTNHYYKAGEVLSRIRKLHGNVKKGFSHDVLLAISASACGATFFTQNKTDFEIIKKIVPLKLECV